MLHKIWNDPWNRVIICAVKYYNYIAISLYRHFCSVQYSWSHYCNYNRKVAIILAINSFVYVTVVSVIPSRQSVHIYRLRLNTKQAKLYVRNVLIYSYRNLFITRIKGKISPLFLLKNQTFNGFHWNIYSSVGESLMYLLYTIRCWLCVNI